jgi:hypothetical protein
MSKPRAQSRAQLGSTGVFQQQPAAPVQPLHTNETRPDRAGRVALPFWVPGAARHQLRILAAEMDTTQQELLTAALNDLFEKHRKPRIA